MPGYSGLDVLKVLSSEQKTCSINVIVVSDNINCRASITYASNIKYIFSKPIEYEILIDKTPKANRILLFVCFWCFYKIKYIILTLASKKTFQNKFI